MKNYIWIFFFVKIYIKFTSGALRYLYKWGHIDRCILLKICKLGIKIIHSINMIKFRKLGVMER